MNLTIRSLLLVMPVGIALLTGSLCAEQDRHAAPVDAAPVDFSREILPLLSEKCFVCHGPDGQDKDVLRLDSFAAATQDLGGYRAIDPDAPEESEILTRISSDDDPMPPEDAEKQLTAVERELLARWIRQGGQYATHWSFIPPRKESPAGQRQRQPRAKSSTRLSRLDCRKGESTSRRRPTALRWPAARRSC